MLEVELTPDGDNNLIPRADEVIFIHRPLDDGLGESTEDIVPESRGRLLFLLLLGSLLGKTRIRAQADEKKGETQLKDGSYIFHLRQTPLAPS